MSIVPRLVSVNNLAGIRLSMRGYNSIIHLSESIFYPVNFNNKQFMAKEMDNHFLWFHNGNIGDLERKRKEWSEILI